MEEITPILAGLQTLRVPAVGGDHAILAGLQKLRVPAVVLNLCCYHKCVKGRNQHLTSMNRLARE